MTENIISGLVVAGVPALVWLAYRHPNAYSGFARGAGLLLYGCLLVWVGYIFGYSSGGRDAVAHAVAGGDLSGFDVSPFGFGVTFTIGGALLLLMALSHIHRLKDD